MQTQGNLFNRGDTLLGVCEALGEDFGFNPTWLRVALAAPVIVSPLAAFGVYGALAVLVLVSRLVFPKPRQPVEAADEQLATAKPLTAENDARAPVFAEAA